MIKRFLPLFTALMMMVPVTIAAGPTAEQIRQFQSLSPQQQAAIKASVEGKKAVSAATAPLPTPVTVKPLKKQSTSKIEKSAEEAVDVVSLVETKEEKGLTSRLRQFGYDLFAGEATTFAPVSEIPVPSEYVIGPGDTLQVFLYGKESAEHQLQVGREGELNFPGIGPIQVAGMRFDELKNSLNQRIAEQMIGVRASITLGRLRSIRVFILGDVRRPGSYTVSALSTMTNALFVSGGVTKIGSLRNIQLKRKGEVVTTLDLYDLLLKGDTSKDVRIRPGDVLFVPPIGEVVGVGGEVRRPALYEVRTEKTVNEFMQMAGGALPTADLKSAQIESITPEGERILLDIDLSNMESSRVELNDGDVLKVYSVLDKMETIVDLKGHVQRPGGNQWFEGMRLSDLIRSDRDLLLQADLGYVLIKRESKHGKKLVVITSSLNKAWDNRGAEDDLLLLPRDQIVVLPLGKNRMGPIYQAVQQLKQEERFGQPAKVVKITGHVRFPGSYPLQDGMNMFDLVNAAMDVLPKTDMEYSVLRRVTGEARELEVSNISLSQMMKAPERYQLLPGDHLIVLGLNDNRVEKLARLVEELKQEERYGQPAKVVTIAGNVQFPGAYPHQEGMTVADLVGMSVKLLEKTDMNYAILRREVGDARRVVASTVPLIEAMKNPDQYKLMPGDQFTVLSLDVDRTEKLSGLIAQLKQEESYGHPAKVVAIQGNVQHPGIYPYVEGMTVSDLVGMSLKLLEKTDMNYAILRREVGDARRVVASSVPLIEAMKNPDRYKLMPGDQLNVFTYEIGAQEERGRRATINRIIAELQGQANQKAPVSIVAVGGLVKFPGKYPLEPGMNLNKLISIAGGFEEAAYTLEAELTHRMVVDGAYRDISHEVIPLGNIQRGEQPDITLQSHDFLNIRKVPLWDEREFVIIEGEVLFPGAYPISRGETLFDLMQRVGGLTDYAFAEGAVFMRTQLQKKEQKEMEALANQLEKQIATLSLEGVETDSSKEADLVTAKELLNQIRSTKAIGRLAVELDDLISSPDHSITLKGGDRLVVPPRSQEVTVLGEVFYPTSHMHEEGKHRLDYVNQSGGATKLADTNNVYVVRANGKVLAAKRIAWFRMAHDEEIRPGDTVVVPLDVKPTDFMTNLKDISQILYQLATTTAALQTVGAI